MLNMVYQLAALLSPI